MKAVTTRILIVDDSPSSRRALRLPLEALGYAVEEAADGFQALEQYVLNPPHVVVLDLVMSGRSGMKILAKLLQINPSALVVIATVDVKASTVTKVRALGAKALLSKPVSSAELAATLYSVLNGGDMWR